MQLPILDVECQNERKYRKFHKRSTTPDFVSNLNDTHTFHENGYTFNTMYFFISCSHACLPLEYSYYIPALNSTFWSGDCLRKSLGQFLMRWEN